MALAPAHRSRTILLNRYFYPDESATSQLLTDLSIGLTRKDLDIHVICSRQLYGEPGAKLAPRGLVEGVHIHRVWTTRFGRGRHMGRAIDYATFYLSSAMALLKLARRGDTVVAKTDPPLVSIIALMAAKLKRAHLVNWLQDLFPEVASQLHSNPLPKPVNSLLLRMRDTSLRHARMNVVLGEDMRRFVESRKVEPQIIRVIENWASSGGQAPKSAASSALRTELGLQGKFVVAYSGNLGRAHEYRTILDAAAKLQGEPRFVFLMIGSGAAMSHMKQAVAAEKISNVRFLGYRPRSEIQDSLACADVHWLSLLPALEGLIVPSKFYGILAAGRPVVFIGSRNGELARIIRSHGCGLAIEVGESEVLTARLQDLATNPPLCETLGRASFELFCQRYTAQRALESWISVLAQARPATSVVAQRNEVAVNDA